MKKLFGVVVLLLMGSLLVGALDAGSKPLPPYPGKTQIRERSDLRPHHKAVRLYELAQSENVNLQWDDCLSTQARRRARSMAEAGYFEHEDPRVGYNPAWDLVASCYSCRYAGENLTKGYRSAEETHQALMESRAHRRNILNPRFERLGVGCYDHICVELFAGF